jgi:hypothetical protein
MTIYIFCVYFYFRLRVEGSTKSGGFLFENKTKLGTSKPYIYFSIFGTNKNMHNLLSQKLADFLKKTIFAMYSYGTRKEYT